MRIFYGDSRRVTFYVYINLQPQRHDVIILTNTLLCQITYLAPGGVGRRTKSVAKIMVGVMKFFRGAGATKKSGWAIICGGHIFLTTKEALKGRRTKISSPYLRAYASSYLSTSVNVEINED